MKKLVISIFIICITSGTVQSQAHLGLTEYQIRNKYPEKKWSVNYTSTSRIKYISADMVYGNFAYYFDNETKLSYFCVQIPFNLATMNGQIEAYNKKYVITSATSWTAYLDEGGIMYIDLVYDRENKQSYFTYSDTR